MLKNYTQHAAAVAKEGYFVLDRILYYNYMTVLVYILGR